MIDRIRQVNLLFISNEALEEVSKIEEIPPNLPLGRLEIGGSSYRMHLRSDRGSRRSESLNGERCGRIEGDMGLSGG